MEFMISKAEAAVMADESFRAGALSMGQCIRDELKGLHSNGVEEITAEAAYKLAEAVMIRAGIVTPNATHKE